MFFSKQMGVLPGAVALGFALASLCAAEDLVARGRYLTNEVAKCADCHTPMGPQGPDKAKWLKGGPLGFQPIEPVKGWHKTAPDLTSGSPLWQHWGEAALVKFLETGVNPGGHMADPPMPAYKMKHEDAQAVVAYLKSLK